MKKARQGGDLNGQSARHIPCVTCGTWHHVEPEKKQCFNLAMFQWAPVQLLHLRLRSLVDRWLFPVNQRLSVNCDTFSYHFWWQEMSWSRDYILPSMSTELPGRWRHCLGKRNRIGTGFIFWVLLCHPQSPAVAWSAPPPRWCCCPGCCRGWRVPWWPMAIQISTASVSLLHCWKSRCWLKISCHQLLSDAYESLEGILSGVEFRLEFLGRAVKVSARVRWAAKSVEVILATTSLAHAVSSWLSSKYLCICIISCLSLGHTLAGNSQLVLLLFRDEIIDILQGDLQSALSPRRWQCVSPSRSAPSSGSSPEPPWHRSRIVATQRHRQMVFALQPPRPPTKIMILKPS